MQNLYLELLDQWKCVVFFAGCWECDPHSRPSFKEILRELDVIVRSGFTQTPHESFHTMQDGWKKEIAEVLQELRKKEKVREFYPAVVHFLKKVFNEHKYFKVISKDFHYWGFID